MKNLLLTLLLAGSTNLVAQVTYVNYFDAVYSLSGTSGGYPPFDVNGDGTGRETSGVDVVIIDIEKRESKILQTFY